MFFISRPCVSIIEAFLDRARLSDFTYPNIGESGNTSVSPNYNIDRNTIRIGHGENDWEKSRQAIRDWKMFAMPWVDLCWPTAPIEKGQTVAVLIRNFGFYSLNAARIVYVIDEPDRFGFAYGTLLEHGESGEERFSVEIDRETGNVNYDIFAFSKPNHFLANLGYPLTRMLQKQFATDSKTAMLRAITTIS